MRCVGEVERLGSELQFLALRDPEGSEDAKVDIDQSGPIKRIASGVAESYRSHGPEGVRVIERHTHTNVAELLEQRASRLTSSHRGVVDRPLRAADDVDGFRPDVGDVPHQGTEAGARR